MQHPRCRGWGEIGKRADGAGRTADGFIRARLSLHEFTGRSAEDGSSETAEARRGSGQTHHDSYPRGG